MLFQISDPVRMLMCGPAGGEAEREEVEEKRSGRMLGRWALMDVELAV